MAALRREVLSVYRRILRVSVIWEAGVTGDTLAEREYIRNETTSLFRKNREVGPSPLGMSCHCVVCSRSPDKRSGRNSNVFSRSQQSSRNGYILYTMQTDDTFIMFEPHTRTG